MLHSGLTREWVGVGELPKERTQSKMAESLQCIGRGHKWRDRSMSSSHKNLNAMEMLRGGDMVGMIRVAGELDYFSAHIHLRKPDKSEDKAK
ncbi:hypothetical protein BHE74_00009941 [Ensete ventricosum]|nr:hypothetical protein BHE74_00009941 [Ensete ventricosum]